MAPVHAVLVVALLLGGCAALSSPDRSASAPTPPGATRTQVLERGGDTEVGGGAGM